MGRMYHPTDQEVAIATWIQGLALVGFFLPGTVALLHPVSRRSPCIRYWARASAYWGVLASMAGVATLVLHGWLGSWIPLVVVVAVHAVATTMGMLGALSHLPFGYFGVGDAMCHRERSILWYDPSPPDGEESEESSGPGPPGPEVAPPVARRRTPSSPEETQQIYPR